MEVLEKIIENYPEDTFRKMDGFDGAIIGVDEDTHTLVYDKNKIIAILTKDNLEWSELDVIEWYEFNVVRSVRGRLGYPKIIEVWK